MSRPAVRCCYPRPAQPNCSPPRFRVTAAKSNGHRPPASAPALIFGDLWPYDPAPETADPGIEKRYELFINGKFVAPKKSGYFDSINPATEEKLSEIALAKAGRCGRGVRGGEGGVRRGVGQDAGRGTRQIPLPHRAAVAGSRARICRGRNARRRQADQGIARLRRAGGGGAFLLSRGLGGQAGIRVSRAAPSPNPSVWWAR